MIELPRHVFAGTGGNTYTSHYVTTEEEYRAAIAAGWCATILEAIVPKPAKVDLRTKGGRAMKAQGA